MRSLLATIIVIGAFAAQSVTAMNHCGSRDEVISKLSDRYAESHVGSGFQSETGLLEIWASDSDGSWTILLTRPDGQTCVMASGTHWLEALETEMVGGEPA